MGAFYAAKVAVLLSFGQLLNYVLCEVIIDVESPFTTVEEEFLSVAIDSHVVAERWKVIIAHIKKESSETTSVLKCLLTIVCSNKIIFFDFYLTYKSIPKMHLKLVYFTSAY